MEPDRAEFSCPVCRRSAYRDRFKVTTTASELGVSADAFRPSSERFGATADRVVRCVACGHASLLHHPAPNAMTAAYAEAADPVSLREERGQVETGARALAQVERFVSPGRFLDVGCWTGSFLVAARDRGWDAHGVEPSQWAAARAAERGVDVFVGEFEDMTHGDDPFRLVALCDVLEHLTDPGAALDRAASLLDPGGALYLTVPDAGSPLARALGRRWWSVLPMHVQYFTRASMRMLLELHGFVVASVASHAKVFSARYYAERFGGYSAALEKATVRVVELAGVADRLVAPDFRDRMAVIATRSA